MIRLLKQVNKGGMDMDMGTEFVTQFVKKELISPIRLLTLFNMTEMVGRDMNAEQMAKVGVDIDENAKFLAKFAQKDPLGRDRQD